MSFGTPNSQSPQNSAGSFSSLATDLFQVPTQQAGFTPSGGVAVPPGPPATPAPGGAYSPYNQAPQAPVWQPPAATPPVQTWTPPSQQAPASPFGQAPAPIGNPYQPAPPVSQPPSGRSQIERFLQNGTFTQAELAPFQDDSALFDALVMLGSQTPAAPQPPAHTPPTPAVQQPSPVNNGTTSPNVDLAMAANALQAAGILENRGGMYFAKSPEATAIADSLNRQQQEQARVMQEMQNPEAWFNKYGQPIIDQHTAPLRAELESLKQQVVAAQPKPYESWIAQNQANLYSDQSGQRVYSPAGQAYHQVWLQLQQQGVKDESILHTAASNAAMATMATRQAPAAPPTQQTFMQAAAGYQQPLIPGFTAPGTSLSRQGTPQNSTPVDSRGRVDWGVLQAESLNGLSSRV